tara:strand:- start:611 stop:1045 length:435 start_codon:yes stop_codon:yes gene_type:complete
MKKLSVLLCLLILTACGGDTKKTTKKVSYPSSSVNSNNSAVNTLENSDCAEFIELLSAREVAQEYGTTEQWVVANHKVNVWQQRGSNRGKKVGELRPGSRALILEKFQNEYKIKSPLDKSIGYISKIQVKRTLKQHPKTFKSCN